MPSEFDKLGQRRLPRKPKATGKPIEPARVDFDKLSRLEAEYDRRKIETLKVLTLTDKQKLAISHPARKRLFLGANRCLSGSERVYDPVAKIYRRVDRIETAFHVYAVDPSTGKKVIAKANAPVCKGVDELYRVMLSNGRSFVATRGHVLAVPRSPHWVQVQTVVDTFLQFGPFRLRSSEDTDLGAFPEDVPYWMETGTDSQSCYLDGRRLRDARPRAAQGNVQCAAPLRGGAQEQICFASLRSDGSADTQERIRPLLPSDRPSTRYGPLQTSVRFAACETRAFGKPFRQAEAVHQAGWQSAGTSSPVLHTNYASDQSASRFSVVERERLLAVSDSEQLASICRSSLRSRMPRCLPDTFRRCISESGQYPFSRPPIVAGTNRMVGLWVVGVKREGRGRYYDFEVPDYGNYVHADAVHHNTGKTSLLAIDIALVVTGKHPTRKYPDGYEGKIYCVGKDTNALAKVFYKKLFTRGEFWLIRDENTREWRSFHPTEDAHRKDEAKQAPSLIPRRMILEESFRIKKTKVPKTVIIKNERGQTWEIDFFTGNAEPQRGVNLDAVYFSEEIEDSDWYSEMMARLLDRHGYFVWDAAQQDGSDALSELDDEAERQLENPEPDVWKVRFSLYDNPYIPRDEIEFLERSLHSQEERDIRIHGLSATVKIRMFNEFAVDRHTFYRDWLPKSSIPLDWCRFMALDPGIECACALFAAVPPPSFTFHPNLILVYDEIYVSGETVPQIAKRIANKLIGQSIWAFLIDEHQGSKRSSATGRKERDQYTDEFVKLGVRSERTGTTFWPGWSEVGSGIQMIRTALMPTPESGKPRLMFLENSCINAVNEFRMLKRDKVKNKYGGYEYLDVPAPRQADHAVDCARYLVGHNPQWHKPTPPRSTSWIENEVERYHRSKRNRRTCVVLGPRPKEKSYV